MKRRFQIVLRIAIIGHRRVVHRLAKLGKVGAAFDNLFQIPKKLNIAIDRLLTAGKCGGVSLLRACFTGRQGL